MQNKFKNFRSFLKGKGYYIVLLLCTAAVGVTGYFLLTDKEPTASVETTIQNSNNNEATESAPSASEKAANVAATQSTEATLPTQTKQPLRLKRPVSGQAVVSFAADRLAYNETTRDWRTHEGIDLAAALGESVLAAADGTVYTIYEDESLGMTVVVQHADGYTTHYSNLSEEIAVSVGQELAAGDTLGTVGQSACIETATEAHVHFALYLDNVPIDPADYWE